MTIPDEIRLEVELTAGVWTNYAAKLDARLPVAVECGKQGHDFLADVGEMRWQFLNADNIFSPNHASVVAGWELGARVRLRIKVGVTTYTRFFGELALIQPDPAREVVECVAYDGMWRFKRAEARTPALLSNRSGGELVRMVCGDAYYAPGQEGYWRVEHPVYGAVGMKAAVGTEGYDADIGDSVFAWVGDAWPREGTKVYDALQDICESELGHVYIARDGMVVFEERTRRALVNVDALSLTVANLGQLWDTQDRRRLYSNVRVRVYPRVQSTALVVIWSATTQLDLPPVGEIRLLSCPFRDPDQEAIRVAAWYVAPLSYAVDWTTSPAGWEQYVNLSMHTTARGAEIQVTTRAGAPASLKLATLQIRGKLLDAYTAVDVEAEDSGLRGKRGAQALMLVLPLENDPGFGMQVASSWLRRWARAQDYVTLAVDGRISSTMLAAVASLDIGDRVLVTESETGLADRFFVEGLHLVLDQGGGDCRLYARCSPVVWGAYWVVGRSAVGVDTIPAL